MAPCCFASEPSVRMMIPYARVSLGRLREAGAERSTGWRAIHAHLPASGSPQLAGQHPREPRLGCRVAAGLLHCAECRTIMFALGAYRPRSADIRSRVNAEPARRAIVYYRRAVTSGCTLATAGRWRPAYGTKATASAADPVLMVSITLFAAASMTTTASSLLEPT